MQSEDLDEMKARLAKFELRVAELERDSHPPVDLNEPAYRAMAKILIEAANIALGKAERE